MEKSTVLNLPEIAPKAVVKGDVYAETTAKVVADEVVEGVGELIEEKLMPLLKIIYPDPDKTLVVALLSLGAGIDFGTDIYTDNGESLKALFGAVVDSLNKQRAGVIKSLTFADRLHVALEQAEAMRFSELAKEGMIGNA